MEEGSKNRFRPQDWVIGLGIAVAVFTALSGVAAAELARGLSSFSSQELQVIKGKRSKEIEKILGYPSKSEVVHIDDMVKI